jgi:LPXTG-motif cell wall-anchored protein
MKLREVKSMRNFKLFLMGVLIVASILVLTTQVAMASVTEGGNTSPQTGGSTGGAKTGAELILFAAAGTGFLGAGYYLLRKSRA